MVSPLHQIDHLLGLRSSIVEAVSRKGQPILEEQLEEERQIMADLQVFFRPKMLCCYFVYSSDDSGISLNDYPKEVFCVLNIIHIWLVVWN
jgi:hypothetical protein